MSTNTTSSGICQSCTSSTVVGCTRAAGQPQRVIHMSYARPVVISALWAAAPPVLLRMHAVGRVACPLFAHCMDPTRRCWGRAWLPLTGRPRVREGLPFPCAPPSRMAPPTASGITPAPLVRRSPHPVAWGPTAPLLGSCAARVAFMREGRRKGGAPHSRGPRLIVWGVAPPLLRPRTDPARASPSCARGGGGPPIPEGTWKGEGRGEPPPLRHACKVGVFSLSLHAW
jgi:hypothetical protein